MTTTSPWADEGAVRLGSASSPSAAELAELPVQALIARYRFGLEAFDPRLFELSDGQLDTAFLPSAGVGRWPVRVLLGHVADAELVQTHRIRRALAEPGCTLGLWDEEAFIDAGLYGEGRKPPIAGFIAVVHAQRRWMSDLLMSLGEAEWARRALHPQQGELSVRWLVAYTAWHLEHHARYLQRKIVAMLGPRPESQAASDAGGAAAGAAAGPAASSRGCCRGEGASGAGTCGAGTSCCGGGGVGGGVACGCGERA